jgi:hypothetical protein
MVHVFEAFGPSHPSVFVGIGIGLFVIAAVHVYRSVRKRRARRKLDVKRRTASHPRDLSARSS